MNYKSRPELRCDEISVHHVEFPAPVAEDFRKALPATTTTTTTRTSTKSLVLSRYAEDDSNVQSQPSHFVDYLSHDWDEQDIWHSWKYVTSDKEVLDHGTRLENTSWRLWAKMRNNLKHVSPETLEWRKDDDLTWLYGPLQSRCPRRFSAAPAVSGNQDSQPATAPTAKSILKDRSISESMFERSLFNISMRQQCDVAALEGKLIGAASSTKLNESGTRPGACDNARPPIAPATSSPMHRSFSWPMPSATVRKQKKQKKVVYFNELVEQRMAVVSDDTAHDNPGAHSIYSQSDRGPIRKGFKSRPNPAAVLKKVPGMDISSTKRMKTLVVLPPQTIKPAALPPTPKKAIPVPFYNPWASDNHSQVPYRTISLNLQTNSYSVPARDTQKADYVDSNPPPPTNIYKETSLATPNQTKISETFSTVTKVDDDHFSRITMMRETLSRSWMSAEDIEDEITAEALFGDAMDAIVRPPFEWRYNLMESCG
ncbi:hypothetical protein BP6252_13892 [Coleophoma cylindrospora]|uniref:Nitrogen regulatory protein areA GATA-like domain-containing protein n=1 Tax=Coleophoma cylindrospora TaxID=1849047 RepID=A0A3D8Q5X0_9HELO|nr:hypothetical protein BP6252_13892 [Coleophoma cylindrospora]